MKTAIAVGILAMAVTAGAQDAAAITAAQQALVHALDSSLPRVPFSQWLRDVVGPDAATKWEVNDCGEQTGNPALDKDRDFPMCGEVLVTLPSQRVLHVSLVVGTFKKGVGGAPRFWAAYLRTSAGAFEPIKTLPEIPAVIRTPDRN